MAEQVDFDSYDVTCARCGKVGPCHVFIVEEGNEWECPECWERCERQERAKWIEPAIVRGVAKWPQCEASLTTHESRAYRERQGRAAVCGLAAKIEFFGGVRLCIRHAKERALAEIIEPAPSGITNSSDGPGTNTGHGHVWKRPDGTVMRCGGPSYCAQCRADQVRFKL